MSSAPPPPDRDPLIGIGTGGGQTGDTRMGDVAGQDIHHHAGMTIGDLLSILDRFANEMQYRRTLEDYERRVRREQVDEVNNQIALKLEHVREQLGHTDHAVEKLERSVQSELFWFRVALIVGGICVLIVILMAIAIIVLLFSQIIAATALQDVISLLFAARD